MGRAIRKLSVKETQGELPRGLYGDGGGLYLQVSKFGTKSWIYRFMMAGRARKMGLGDFERMPLAKAREAATEAYALVKKGIDPIAQRNAMKAEAAAAADQPLTFRECAERYIGAQQAYWENEKHRQQWSSTLETYAYPTIGKFSVDRVEVRHIIEILLANDLWTTKHETATRVRSRINLILQWAHSHGYRKSSENPAAWPGKLKDALPRISKSKLVQHHPAVPIKEMPEVIARIRQKEGVSARALQFLALTASRTRPVRLATWSEIDFDERVWTCPPGHMKNRKEHKVPLSPAAIALLKSLPHAEKFIFPGARSNTPLSEAPIAGALREIAPGYVPHGLRSTFKDWCGETRNYANEMSEIALAHTVSDQVERAYRRGAMLEKRRRMMNDWATFCNSHGSRVNVVEIGGRK
jgi:integrase